MTAWTYFNSEKSKIFAAEGKRKEAFSLSSEAWGKCTDEDKAPYVKMAEESKVRFEKQVDELKKKGYYTLEDGSKSTDPQNATLLKVKKKTIKKTDESVAASAVKAKPAPKSRQRSKSKENKSPAKRPNLNGKKETKRSKSKGSKSKERKSPKKRSESKK